MGFMTDKRDQEIEQAQKAQTKEQAAAVSSAVTVAVAAAIVPLQREITSLKGEINELKKTAEKPTAATEIQYSLDDKTNGELKRFTASVTEGIESYKLPIYSLFCIPCLYYKCTTKNRGYRR